MRVTAPTGAANAPLSFAAPPTIADATLLSPAAPAPPPFDPVTQDAKTLPRLSNTLSHAFVAPSVRAASKPFRKLLPMLRLPEISSLLKAAPKPLAVSLACWKSYCFPIIPAFGLLRSSESPYWRRVVTICRLRSDKRESLTCRAKSVSNRR
ncbi:hypothetical protein D9M70_480200 [compost metagenome]